MLAAVLFRLQDPHTVFFTPYMVTALLTALFWLRRSEGWTWDLVWRRFAKAKSWRAPSTRQDAVLTLAYLAVLRLPVASVEAGCFYGTLSYLGPLFSDWVSLSLHAPEAIEAGLATAVTMLAIDFSSYWTHRAMHEIPWLWRIHALHHSAEVLTPLTTYRQHPFEPLLLNAARGSASAVGLALLHAFFKNQTPVLTVAGLGAGFFVYMLTTNLHHCQVPVRYPRTWRWLFISPHQHQLHHSSKPEHHNRNYGVVFSFWDRACGTLLDAAPRYGELSYGLGQPGSETNAGPSSLLGGLVYPLLPFLPRAGATRSLLRRRLRFRLGPSSAFGFAGLLLRIRSVALDFNLFTIFGGAGPGWGVGTSGSSKHGERAQAEETLSGDGVQTHGITSLVNDWFTEDGNITKHRDATAR